MATMFPTGAASVAAPLAIGEGGIVVAAAAAEPTPEGESITGFREFVSPAASALYRIEIPADGAYSLARASTGSSWPGAASNPSDLDTVLSRRNPGDL